MLKLTRRSLVAGASALPLATAVSRSALAAEFSYKFATNLPSSHPLNVRISQALDNIREKTAGKLSITLFANSVLGTDPVMLSEVRSGAIQFFSLSPLILSTLVPVSAINGVGFAFKDEKQAFAAMDGNLGEYIRGEIAKAGLIAFDNIFDNGFRQITTSNHPIVQPADLKGLRIRVPSAALWTSMFKDFGAAPTTISFNEVYTSLQTKIVEAQENPLAIIEFSKLYEVQKYCSLTNHMWDGFWMLANPAFFKKLPSDMQEIVRNELNAAALLQRADMAQLSAGLQTKLAQQGLIFNTTNPDSFRSALKQAGFYNYWEKRFGSKAWSLLESYTGPLA